MYISEQMDYNTSFSPSTLDTSSIRSKTLWHVLYTSSMCEKKVAERLSIAGIEHYLPLCKTVKQWSDRKKKIEQPLIRSVVFVKASESELKAVYSIQGVKGILKFLGRPAIVQEHEIQSLRILLQQEHVDVLEQVDIQSGDMVEVTYGPFKGMQACAIQLQNTMRLIIEIKNMGVGFSVNVPKSYVKPL